MPLSATRSPAYRAATWIYSQFRSGRLPRPGLRILMYHAVGASIEDPVGDRYNTTFPQFESQMRYLVEHYPSHLVPFDYRISNNDPLKIALTFDDGYRDNLTLAAPLLVELRIPFAVFVSTGAVAGRKAGFLGPEELRELASLPGAKIGAHSVSHALLTTCDAYKLHEELHGSKAYLEDLLGREVDSLAYPYGAVDRRVRDTAENLGYRSGVTTRFDINLPLRDPLLLCRTHIWSDDDTSVFEKKLRGDWDWLRWRHPDPARLV
jgi:peptidoglycan/xylan/chitin deacetylase (PgdA/CDA1 family)